MANTKLTSLTGLSNVVDDDLFYVVDVSDHAEGSSGTSKKVTKNILMKDMLVGGTSIIDVKRDYGATGNGITDDTTAIQSALAAGGQIYFPAGTYLTTASLSYYSNSHIVGAGRGITIIKVMDGSTLSNAHGVLEPVGWGDGGAPAVDNVYISNLTIDGNHDNVTGEVDGIVLSKGVDLTLYNCEAYECKEVGFAIDSAVYATGAVRGTLVLGCYSHDNESDGFQAQNGTLIGCHSYDNGGTGFRNAGSGTAEPYLYRLILQGCNAYRNASYGIGMAPQAGGTVLTASIDGCYSGDNTGDGFVIGMIGQRISNCISTGNGEAGVRVGVDNTSVTNCVIKNNGQVGSTYTYGIVFFSDRKNVVVSGNRIYDDQSSATQTYGIFGDGYAAGVSGNTIHIFNNDLSDNGTGAIGGNMVLSGGNITPQFSIKNNAGYNPVGVSAITEGASPFTHTADSAPETVYITGGTVSSVVKGGVTLFTSTDCTVELEPSESVVVTYTVKPDMVRDIH